MTSLPGAVSAFQGNRAIIVGKLPAGEVFTFTGGFGPITHVAALIEDNGAASGTPVDRAAAIWLKGTSATQFCTTKPISDVASGAIGLDAGDASFGYTDLLDAYPANPDTTVSVVNPNGLSVAITDAPDGDPIDKGLQVTVGAGSGSADLIQCGYEANVTAGGTVIFTCGSLITHVVTGSAEVILEDGLSFVSIPAGGRAEIADDGSGGFTVANLGTTPVTVTVDGIEGTIAPGETSTVEAWDFQGFTGLAGAPAMNKGKNAGSALPLKWRLLDGDGAPVTNLGSAAITVTKLSCATGADLGNAQPGSTAGPLQNLGNGYYQLNWKTAKDYAGTCKAMHLDVGDGVTHDALFTFTK